jgi:hypothetical protein
MSVSFTTWRGADGAAVAKKIVHPALAGHQVKTTYSGVCGTNVDVHGDIQS